MKSISKILAGSVTCAALVLPYPTAIAAGSKEAKVTQIIREVKLVPENAAARDAALNDKISEDTGVRTGGDSRSELTFPDLTITRLGANTIFSFNKSGRTAKVDTGSILLRVPKDSGGGTIRSSAVTVAITGTTVIFEGSRGGRSKLYNLEGSSRVALKSKPSDWRKVMGGQMLDVPAGATTLPMPVNFDVNQLMRTHPLITDFKPLPSAPLIMAVAQQPPPAVYNGPTISVGPNIFPIPIYNPPGHHRNPQQNPTVPPRPNRSPPPTHQPPGTTKPPGTNSQPTPTPPPVITRTKQPTYTPKPSPTPNRVFKKKPTTSSGPR
ncbi:MAG: FecR domain-containing protein [Chthoniobacterales bacterium]